MTLAVIAGGTDIPADPKSRFQSRENNTKIMMTSLTIEQLELEIEGGWTWKNTVDAACAVIGAGSVTYAAGVFFGWWNPIGWVSAGCLAADAACAGWTLYRVGETIANESNGE